MREVEFVDALPNLEAASFRACLATILECNLDELPQPVRGEEPARDPIMSRWLAGLALGLVPIAGPKTFAWAGPWLARVQPPRVEPRFVVMYGQPSGVVWDPAHGAPIEHEWIDVGFLVAAGDIALARPAPLPPPIGTGVIETIAVAPAAGEPAVNLSEARALPGQGLEGDRHIVGKGTFPSGLPGSALTLIEAEVCESFDPPLGPNDHRRNLVTRGIDLNGLVGQEFMVGSVHCRCTRLCEPCTVVNRYASRPVLRALVHRGGIRADILTSGVIQLGDAVKMLAAAD